MKCIYCGEELGPHNVREQEKIVDKCDSCTTERGLDMIEWPFAYPPFDEEHCDGSIRKQCRHCDWFFAKKSYCTWLKQKLVPCICAICGDKFYPQEMRGDICKFCHAEIYSNHHI